MCRPGRAIMSQCELKGEKMGTQTIVSKLLKPETQDMYAFCRDISRNIPKERTAFPKTDDDTRCRSCQFKELCNDSSID